MARLDERVETQAETLTRCEGGDSGAPLIRFLQVAAKMVPILA